MLEMELEEPILHQLLRRNSVILLCYSLTVVHGFGASISHWRRNIETLAQNHTVYAIDLLGFDDSDKPKGFSYTMETWAELILDFLHQVIQKPTVLIRNSVGSLACIIAASSTGRVNPLEL